MLPTNMANNHLEWQTLWVRIFFKDFRNVAFGPGILTVFSSLHKKSVGLVEAFFMEIA